MPNWVMLQSRINGVITTQTSSDFHSFVDALTWNEIKPNRLPTAIVTVKDEDDVVESIRFAKKNGLQVTVHGGGHSWIGLSTRQGGMVIDLSLLNKTQINKKNRTALIQPVISNQALAAELKKHGLAFPLGHCPTVKASGYLLNGGMSWNLSAWGPACWSVKAIDFITAAGEKITASETAHADLFWAARGCGPGMFAVATQFHLSCYPHPKAIMASTYFCALDKLQQITEEVTMLGWKMPSFVELSIFLIKAPPELEDACKSTHGKLCMITAAAFADSTNDAKAALAGLKNSQMAMYCLAKTEEQSTNFNLLMEASGATWPENHRTLAESLCSHAKPVDILIPLREKIIQAPSPKSVIVLCISTGGHNLLRSNENMALSMDGQLYGGSWAIWEDPSDDAVNMTWQNEVLAILKPFTHVHYVGETDFVQDSTRLSGSFPPEKWARLQQIRSKYDPDGLFFSYLDGMTA